jgi:hypothetical protein
MGWRGTQRSAASENDSSALHSSIALIEQIRAASDETERGRCLQNHIAAAMKDAGVFGMAMPREWGGAELDPLAQIRVIEALRWLLDGPTNTDRLRGDVNDEEGEGAGQKHQWQRHQGPGEIHRRTVSSPRLRGELSPLADDSRPNAKRCNRTIWHRSASKIARGPLCRSATGCRI